MYREGVVRVFLIPGESKLIKTKLKVGFQDYVH